VFLRQQRGGSAMESVLMGNVLAILAGLPFAVRFPPPAAAWPGIVLMGVCLLSVPFFLYTRALRRITAVEAVLIKGLEPVLGPTWVYLLIGESPGRWAALGGFVVFAAVTLRALLGAPPGGRAPTPPQRTRGEIP